MPTRYHMGSPAQVRTLSLTSANILFDWRLFHLVLKERGQFFAVFVWVMYDVTQNTVDFHPLLCGLLDFLHPSHILPLTPWDEIRVDESPCRLVKYVVLNTGLCLSTSDTSFPTCKDTNEAATICDELDQSTDMFTMQRVFLRTRFPSFLSASPLVPSP